VLLTVLAAAGCGGAGEVSPPEIGPRGVDELEIPTPDPEPDDFVAAVDNPWLPLSPGSAWTYEVSGSVVEQLDVLVESDSRDIGGIPCVVVHHTGIDAEGEVVLEGDSYYAQDTRGNVWLLGEEVRGIDSELSGLSRSWTADEDGAGAGLAMAATPRVGDGYVRAFSPDVDDRSTVLSVDEERVVPAGTFGGLVLVEDRLDDTSTSPVVLERAYAEGVGLVEQTSSSGSALSVALLEARSPGR
jgi:hypothetical protein